MNKIVGLTLGISLMAGLILAGAGCIKTDKTAEPGMQTMPTGQNVTGQGDALAMQTMLAGENVTAPGTDIAAR